jgi:alkylhydroperoxidase family enzyme
MAVANPLRVTEWGECVVPATPLSSALRTRIESRLRMVPPWAPYVAAVPWVLDFMCDIVARPVAHAPSPLCDLVSLVVTQDNSCRYCYGAQRAVLKIYGYADEYVDRLLRDFHAPELSAADQAALEFARRLSRAHPRPGAADFDTVVRAGLAPIAVAEIAAVVAAGTFNNRISTFLALPLEEFQIVQRPLFRLIRPLVAWRIRPRRQAPAPAPTPDEGPWMRLVAALDGSPSAAVIRRNVDAALASAVLPRRTNLLMLAVIARALGCTYAEAECRRLLAGEGIGAADLDEILATLASRRLDAREAKLVPFARETVRYQPGPIQTRVREVAATLTPEETLEAVGVVSLGNALCRLSIVLDPC